MNYKVVAIETAVADTARLNAKDALGFPTFTRPAGEGLPCRHCLQWIETGAPATFFTLDPFAGTETLPLPGPVYVHADGCERYSSVAGIANAFAGESADTECVCEGAEAGGAGVCAGANGFGGGGAAVWA